MNYLYQIKLDEIDYQITHIIFWENVRKLRNFALEVGSQIHYFNMPRITLIMSLLQKRFDQPKSSISSKVFLKLKL